jgi:hypothetical protein
MAVLPRPGRRWLGPFPVAPMISANSLLPILRRLVEVERKRPCGVGMI